MHNIGAPMGALHSSLAPVQLEAARQCAAGASQAFSRIQAGCVHPRHQVALCAPRRWQHPLRLPPSPKRRPPRHAAFAPDPSRSKFRAACAAQCANQCKCLLVWHAQESVHVDVDIVTNLAGVNARIEAACVKFKRTENKARLAGQL